MILWSANRTSDEKRRGWPGFTLVELMVAVALLGLVMTIIFALFSTTSDSLYEADSLADTIDRARFAAERVSNDVQSAGAYGTPDAAADMWVRPKPDTGSQLHMHGLVTYEGTDHTWQDQEVGDLNDDHQPSAISDQTVGFDGIIVVGAIDFPQSFEINNLQFQGSGDESGRVAGGFIPPNERGLYKLLLNDPFYTRTGPPQGLTVSDNHKVVTRDLQNRVVRVMDRAGYFQFSGVQPTDWNPDNTNGLNFRLRSPWVVRNNSADAGGVDDVSAGLERGTADDEDVGYDAALLDAYWYYVEQDPSDEANFRLIRERLDAHELLADAGREARVDDPTTYTAKDTAGSDQRQRMVVTDRVVDFQIWFDCADNQGNVVGANWQEEWAEPPPGECIETQNEPGKVRGAHLRLSLRTEHERQDNPDSAEALFFDEEGNVDETQSLRYFNVYPDAEGSARVVTVQNDLDLATYGLRNVDYRTGGS